MNLTLLRFVLVAGLMLGALQARAQLVFEPQTTNQVFAFCFDPATGQVIPNCNVTLQSFAYFEPNQHNHQNPPPPTSALVPNSGNTGTTGLPVNIVTTQVGQFETAYVCAAFCTFNDYTVAYSGLLEVFPSLDYVLIGVTNAHPLNHFLVPPVRAAIQVVAQRYRMEFPANPVIALNDMSLPLAGKFDLNLTWTTGSHFNHSRGFATDVRGNGGPNSIPQVPAVQQRFIQLCRDAGALIVLHESVGAQNEHFHCEF
jgi:hypothetical protein